jgi:hypothetical protein
LCSRLPSGDKRCVRCIAGLAVAVVLAVLAGSACLAADENTACRSTRDCAGARVCIDGGCVDESCEVLCQRLCAAIDTCGMQGAAAPDCDACGSDMPTATALGVPSDKAFCTSVLEEAETTADECVALACPLECVDVCKRGVACGDVDQQSACVEGCIASSCDLGVPPTECPDGPALASCYEVRGLFDEDVLCNEARPCETAGHPCKRNGHCCGFFADTTVCIDDETQSSCADVCWASVECVSGCCVPLEGVGYGACGVSETCL